MLDRNGVPIKVGDRAMVSGKLGRVTAVEEDDGQPGVFEDGEPGACVIFDDFGAWYQSRYIAIVPPEPTPTPTPDDARRELMRMADDGGLPGISGEE